MAGRKKKATRKTTRGGFNPIDVHVGNRLKERRTMLGMTQEQVAEAVGLTFQQIQKYERGANRLGASRLYDLSQVLDVPISYFFSDLPPEVAASSPRLLSGPAPRFEPDINNQMIRRETLELVRAYYKIDSSALRGRVRDFIKSLASMEDEPT